MTVPVLYAVADGVATITLNRPEKRNALNSALCEGLLQAATSAAADERWTTYTGASAARARAIARSVASASTKGGRELAW